MFEDLGNACQIAMSLQFHTLFRVGSLSADDVISFTVSNYDTGQNTLQADIMAKTQKEAVILTLMLIIQSKEPYSRSWVGLWKPAPRLEGFAKGQRGRFLLVHPSSSEMLTILVFTNMM